MLGTGAVISGTCVHLESSAVSVSRVCGMCVWYGCVRYVHPCMGVCGVYTHVCVCTVCTHMYVCVRYVHTCMCVCGMYTHTCIFVYGVCNMHMYGHVPFMCVVCVIVQRVCRVCVHDVYV